MVTFVVFWVLICCDCLAMQGTTVDSYKFDLIWGAKGLIVTRSNLVVAWKVRLKMGIISWFSLGLCWLSQGGHCWFLFAVEFSICAHKERKIRCDCVYLVPLTHATITMCSKLRFHLGAHMASITKSHFLVCCNGWLCYVFVMCKC